MSNHPTPDNFTGISNSATKGLSTLVNEDVFQLNKFEDPINQIPANPKGKLISWMKNILFQLHRSKDNTGQESVKTQSDLVNWMEDNRTHLSRGFKNLKNKVKKKAFRYPWVVGMFTILAVGFLLVRLIKPTRKVLKVLE